MVRNTSHGKTRSGSGRRIFRAGIFALVLLGWPGLAGAAVTLPHYYAHDAVLDESGVLAPWYQGQNGQCDLRVRIAAETLKRYPWTAPGKAAAVVPEYVFNGTWAITGEGVISVPPLRDWDNGDLGQRAAYVLSGLVDYYRYSGDAAAIAHLTLLADTLLDHCLTPADHVWPGFLVSCPTKGQPYGACDPSGMIQLDIVAEVGLALTRAYQLTGNERWWDAVKHWGDLLAQHRNVEPGLPPWNRYANPQDVPWEDQMTGGVAFLLAFFDELLRLGYAGENGAITTARDAGQAYLRDVLLPQWTVDDTWGRNYWDWPDPVQAENVTEFVARYLMEHPDLFPNWRQDVRNILGLFLHRTGVDGGSRGDVYHGAWAYPESSGCCGRSLWYGPMELATVWAQYAALAGSEWAWEIARRQQVLATYDVHETGVVEDNIDGGQIVAGSWFKIAHPMALKHVLGSMAWQPDVFGANRENHIMRSSAVVSTVTYGKGRIAYATYDAPGNTIEVLRLSFLPSRITAGNQALAPRTALDANGFMVTPLSNGDCLVTVRHDGLNPVAVEGDDPQSLLADDQCTYEGEWQTEGHLRVASAANASLSCTFMGNQVRVIGPVMPEGGLAEVYLDGVKQLVGIDCWNPSLREQQVLYYRNGLENAEHNLKIAVQGQGNPRAQGARVAVEGIQCSSAEGKAGSGAGRGPVETQRMIFGYPEREDYTDSAGNAWRPATEWIVRAGALADAVKQSWWSARRRLDIANTADPELYRYGAHAQEFWANLTTGPGSYHVRLKFAETRAIKPEQRAVTILINGQEMARDVDLAATAGGMHRAVDLVFEDIAPVHGVIEVRLRNDHQGEAILQALEIGPGAGGPRAEPVCLTTVASETPASALRNPGFEEGAPKTLGAMGAQAEGGGWRCLFAGTSQSYIWEESGYDIHPEWGLPEYHGGKQAVRTHTDGRGHTILWQEATVRPDHRYRASVWVHGVDLHGKGFGQNAADSAGLLIQELDAKGQVTVDHPKAEIRTAGTWENLSIMFRTAPQTARVRFVLDTVLACRYDEGHVTYDDCALESLESGDS